MNITKEQKKKIVFGAMAVLIIIIVILILVEGVKRNIVNDTQEEKISPVLNKLSLCEEKIIDEFQVIEPEFQWKESDTSNENSYYGKVTYQEENQVKVTEFECKIGNSGNEVRINRDIENNPNAEAIIYDDWE